MPLRLANFVLCSICFLALLGRLSSLANRWKANDPDRFVKARKEDYWIGIYASVSVK